MVYYWFPYFVEVIGGQTVFGHGTSVNLQNSQFDTFLKEIYLFPNLRRKKNENARRKTKKTIKLNAEKHRGMIVSAVRLDDVTIANEARLGAAMTASVLVLGKS